MTRDTADGGEDIVDLDYLLDVHGCEFTLPHGVPSRLRYHMRNGKPVTFRVANRDFLVPDAHSIKLSTERVIMFICELQDT